MPTTTKSRYSAKKALSDYVYVPLGAGQLLMEKTKEAGERVWTVAQKQQGQAVKTYRDLAKRGERLVTSIRRSVYTRRAIDQAKTARSQAKGTVTSLRKTAGATASATRSAAKKVS